MVIPRHSISATRYIARFVNKQAIKACWSHKFLPLHIASLANSNTKIWFRQGCGDGYNIDRGTGTGIVHIDDVPGLKAIRVPILLDFSCQFGTPDDSSVHLQGSYRPCKCCKLQIRLIHNEQNMIWSCLLRSSENAKPKVEMKFNIKIQVSAVIRVIEGVVNAQYDPRWMTPTTVQLSIHWIV